MGKSTQVILYVHVYKGKNEEKRDFFFLNFDFVSVNGNINK